MPRQFSQVSARGSCVYKEQAELWSLIWRATECESQFEQRANVKFCQKFFRKLPELWHSKNWLLLHENIAVCLSIGNCQDIWFCFATPFIFTWSRTMRFLFLSQSQRKAKWEQISVGRGDVTATREVVQDISASAFQMCLKQLHQRWQMCTAANGQYFEWGWGSVCFWRYCNMVGQK